MDEKKIQKKVWITKWKKKIKGKVESNGLFFLFNFYKV